MPADVSFPARDGFPLAGTLFEPSAPRRPLPVLICPATAVKRSYYARLASYLAGRGFLTLTYDVRGVGGSRPAGSLRAFPARMRDWGEKDLPAALDELAARSGSERVLAIGHSAGGQLLGLADNVSRIAAAVHVAAQSGDFRTWPMPGRLLMILRWYALIPGVSLAFGRVPHWAGIGEDLPGGIAREWAHWGRTPGYLFGGAEGDARRALYARLAVPLLSISLTDDDYAPPRAVEQLLAGYTAARIERRVIAPRDVGVPAIGHFGFFRERFRTPLWDDLAHWLEER